MTDEATERTRRYIERMRGGPIVEPAPAAEPAELEPAPATVQSEPGGSVDVVTDGPSQNDLLRLARLVAMGVLRTRSTPDGLKIERRPESRRERAHRVERKRKRQLSRRGRK